MHGKSSAHIVSVVIPVYNGAKYLRDAIDSVISQTYYPIEIIVVDDGSQDSTWDIIKSYQSKVTGFHKANGGVASALNLGISHSSGDYIAWLSHDDIFSPKKIEFQVNFIDEHQQVGVCYTDFEIVDANRAHVATIHTRWHPTQEMAQSFLRNMYINGSTTMIRKSCFEKVGLFDEALKHTQDLELWLRISRLFEFGHLPQVLLQSRSHPEQGSWDMENQLAEEMATFTDLFNNYGCVTFFPSLETVNNGSEQKALGLKKFGDEMLVHRHWYRFAIDQYQSALNIQPMPHIRMRLFWAKLCIALFGDEYDSLCLAKRARLIINQGDRTQARKLAAKLFIRHPLRLDALGLWMISLIPAPLIQSIKSVKRRINGLLSSKS